MRELLESDEAEEDDGGEEGEEVEEGEGDEDGEANEDEDDIFTMVECMCVCLTGKKMTLSYSRDFVVSPI